MYLKRYFSLIAVSLAIYVFLSACGGSLKSRTDNSAEKSDATAIKVNDSGALTDKKVTLRAFASRGGMHAPFEEMQVLNDMEAETNVHIEWIEPGGNAREKINLLFASNDLPDIFLAGINDTDIMQQADTSLLALDSLIDKNAPNLKVIINKDPEVKKKLTHPNGHIYSTPSNTGFIGNSNPDNLYINKKWLDKLNLKVPATTDEFYTVLRSFKEKDPNGNGKADEIPFSPLIGKGIVVDIFSMFGSFGSPDNPAHLAVENNKVVFSATQPGYREGIMYFAKLYSEKLLDPEAFKQNANQLSTKAKAATPIIGSALNFLDENQFGTERARSEYTYVLPLKGPNGYQLWNNYDNAFSRTGNGCATVTTANKNPEITMRWIDRWYSEKWSLQSFWGHIGSVISKDSSGKFLIKDPPEGMTQDEFRFKSTAVNITPFYLTQNFYDNKLVLTLDQARKAERSKEYSKYFPKQIIPKFFLTVEQDNEKTAIFTDINNYVNQMKQRWITGEGNVQAEWDEYVKTLDKMGVSKYVKMHQELYDSYNIKK